MTSVIQIFKLLYTHKYITNVNFKIINKIHTARTAEIISIVSYKKDNFALFEQIMV